MYLYYNLRVDFSYINTSFLLSYPRYLARGTVLYTEFKRTGKLHKDQLPAAFGFRTVAMVISAQVDAQGDKYGAKDDTEQVVFEVYF